jgi:AraC family transcriptional regulator
MSLVNRALWVIERNLGRELTLGDLAASCGVSRFHLAHAFGESTGRSVMDYVRGRRLTEAAIALAAGAGDILAIALDCGYGSHEAFTRAFRAQFGKTPEEVRKGETIAGLALVEPIRLGGPPVAIVESPRLEQAGTMQFVGLREACPYGATDHIPAQWQRFMAQFYSEIENRMPSAPVGISTIGEDDTMSYVCAAEVSRFGAMPAGLAKLTTAPATYAVFEHRGHVTTLQQTYVAIWNDWFAANGKTPAEAPSLERHNPSFDPRTGNGGVAIWIPIVS